MRRVKFTERPDDADEVTTYGEFLWHLDAMAAGLVNVLIVIGPAGTGKTMAVQARFGKAAVKVGGNARPYYVYVELYHGRRLPFLILDDADQVFLADGGPRLMKMVCESVDIKAVSWPSMTPEIRSGAVRANFRTGARTLVIANRWPAPDPDIEAIQSRAEMLFFNPSPEEMHSYARCFCDDEEVYTYIGQKFAGLRRHDLRLYFKAMKNKRKGEAMGRPDYWRQWIDAKLSQQQAREAGR